MSDGYHNEVTETRTPGGAAGHARLVCHSCGASVMSNEVELHDSWHARLRLVLTPLGSV